jgi:ABC-type branched-subunit amino acid transport system permease subunit
MCGVAGALYVPQVGIINPGEMSPANSSRSPSGPRWAGAPR